jgi:hypothetical protein
LDHWLHIDAIFTSTEVTKERVLQDCICNRVSKDFVGQIKTRFGVLYQEWNPTGGEYDNRSQ